KCRHPEQTAVENSMTIRKSEYAALASANTKASSCRNSEVDLRGEPEGIAIIGIGCRFAGAHGPQEFWRLLYEGRETTANVPADRFDIDEFYDSRPGTPGKVITQRGGFLSQIDHFDAAFFGISPREADRMDPQQRLLLEVSWEALEDAGQVLEKMPRDET